MRLFPLLLMAAALFMARRGLAVPQNDEPKPDPFLHETVKVNGVNLHYATQGKGQVILFLHGFPEFWYAWKEQLPFFGKQYQAVAVDMRGYNLSDKPEKVEDYAVPLLVADIKALIDKLGNGKKVILVAHDWGGAVAWAYAFAHPDTLDKLVIINAPHPTVFSRELQNNPAQQKASGYMTMFRSPQAETILSTGDFAALATGVFGSAKPGAFSDEDKKRYKEAWGRKGGLTGGLNYYRAASLGPPTQGSKPEGSTLAKLPPMHIKVPTLVIWGEKDTALLPGNLEGLDKYVEKLTIKRIPEGSHWVVHEEPELINQTIQQFLSKN